MKKIALVLSLCLILLGSLAAFPQPALAQAPAPKAPAAAGTPVVTPVSPPALAVPPSSPGNEITLAQIGLNDAVMHGPLDAFTATFTPPPEWQLSGGGSVVLTIDAHFFHGTTETTAQPAEGAGSGATMDVTFNGKVIMTILIDWSGERTVSIPIPTVALKPLRSDGRHDLTLFLDASTDCFLDLYQTTIVVRSASKIILPHTTINPPTDLTLLPRPFYSFNTIAPTPVILVLPDAASAGEVQAALTVAAGLGRITGGRIPLTLNTIGRMTDQDKRSAHLIYVGKASSFPELKTFPLPARSDGQTFSSAGMQPDDGIVQEINLPANPKFLLMVVGGNSEAGVIKAGQAVSSGALRVSTQPNLAVIANVQESILASVVATDRTFKDLGYPTVTLSGLGTRRTTYQFYIPLGQMAQDGSYIDLTFNHSALLDYTRSGMVISLNDQSISSIRFTDVNATINTTRISIPTYAIQPGDNFLQVEANMLPSNVCSQFVSTGLWTAVDGASLVHIPLVPAQAENLPVLNMTSYPAPFTSNPTLNSLGFVVPPSDPVAWDTAAKVAVDLGSRTFGSVVTLKTVFNKPADDARGGMDFLVIGKPNTLPFIADLNSSLPAPYENGSNLATERNFSVTYRLPPNTSLGYLQWVAAPWDKNRTVMGVLGSTDLGVQWAGAALTRADLRGKLGGDFAVVRDTQVLTSDSRAGAGTGNLSATIVPAQPGETAQTGQVPTTGRPNWVLGVIVISNVLIVLVLILVAIGARRR